MSEPFSDTVDLTTTYLGLQLKNPLVASASPLSKKIELVKRMEEAGAAAVVSNYTGAFHEARAEAVVDALTRQISGAVRWVDNMAALIAAGPSRIVEIGPNRPLRGFFRALDVDVEAVFNTTTARRVFEAT